MENNRNIEQVEKKNGRKLILDLTNKPFADKIRILRTYEGLTQADLAHKLGFNLSDVSLISRIERGRPGTPRKYIQLLEKYLDDAMKGDE